MADAEEVEEDGGGGSNKKMLAIVGVVALLVGGGGGYGAAIALGGSDAPEEGEEVVEGEEDQPVAAKKTRQVESLERFTVNLRGTGGGRVLRLEVQVEVDEEDLATVTEKKPVLRDAVLTLASDYTYADLEGIDGKMRLRDELLARLNTSLEDAASVRRVYFTEFVVQ